MEGRSASLASQATFPESQGLLLVFLVQRGRSVHRRAWLLRLLAKRGLSAALKQPKDRILAGPVRRGRFVLFPACLYPQNVLQGLSAVLLEQRAATRVTLVPQGPSAPPWVMATHRIHVDRVQRGRSVPSPAWPLRFRVQRGHSAALSVRKQTKHVSCVLQDRTAARWEKLETELVVFVLRDRSVHLEAWPTQHCVQQGRFVRPLA
jgi:hypothetical protein